MSTKIKRSNIEKKFHTRNKKEIKQKLIIHIGSLEKLDTKHTCDSCRKKITDNSYNHDVVKMNHGGKNLCDDCRFIEIKKMLSVLS